MRGLRAGTRDSVLARKPLTPTLSPEYWGEGGGRELESQTMPTTATTTAITASRPFTFTGRLRSFRYAFRGVRLMLASQHNAWVHAAATVLVVVTGFALNVSRIDWCMLVAAIAGVWVAEGMNTAFEFLCDVASPVFHPMVEKAKDVAAGAVLVSAIGAVAIGALVFVPALLARVG